MKIADYGENLVTWKQCYIDQKNEQVNSRYLGVHFKDECMSQDCSHSVVENRGLSQKSKVMVGYRMHTFGVLGSRSEVGLISVLMYDMNDSILGKLY